MRHLRIAEMLLNQPLMISRAKLDVILQVLGPRLNLDLSGQTVIGLEEVSAQARASAGYQVQDGTGIIGICGPLLHRRLGSEYPSGGPTTYGEIRTAFDTALADDGVRAIVLDCCSPGGEVNGAFDLADHIYANRGAKPITAIINEEAQSAAYLLASAADRIIIPRTGSAGSIGVIATHADLSRAEDRAGVTVTHIIAGNRKADGTPHQPLSIEARTTFQGMVDDTYALFVDTVARNRRLSPGVIRDTQAATFIGALAVEVGLADEVAPVDLALTRAGQSGSKSRVAITASQQQTPAPESGRQPIVKGATNMKLEELQAQHPDLLAQIQTDARVGMIAQAAADAAQQEASAAAVAQTMGVVEAVLGEELGGKVSAVVASGVTVEQCQALGVTIAPQAVAEGSPTRAQILEGLQAAAPAALAAVEGAEGDKPTFEQAVTAHQKAHDCTRGTAISAVAKAQPELHAQYLQGLREKK